MKVQIDAIVTKSEALKSESNSELYSRQLTDNGLFDNICIQGFMWKIGKNISWTCK